MNPDVVPAAVPRDSLLAATAAAHSGAYVDCYSTQIMGGVSHAAFVEAFYCSWLFKIERRLLGLFASRPATDADARRLALNESDHFSAWRVEARRADELLMADFTGRTKSWLMVAPLESAASAASSAGTAVGSAAKPGRETATRLTFGSAVVPRRGAPGGSTDLGAAFHLLLGFHKLYSRLLLAAARGRLSRRLSRHIDSIDIDRHSS